MYNWCETIKDMVIETRKRYDLDWLQIKEIVVDDNWFCIEAFKDTYDEKKERLKTHDTGSKRLIKKWRIWQDQRELERYAGKINLCKILPEYKNNIEYWRDIYYKKHWNKPNW